MTRKKDSKYIESKKCQRKGCDWESYAMAKGKFLCEIHFREIIPQKERKFRYSLTKGLLGDKFKLVLM